MDTIKVNNYDEMSKKCAEKVFEKISSSNRVVLGLPTGGTPEKMYDYLAEMLNENGADLSNVYTVNLDEYVGLSGEHIASYRNYMNTVFFDKVTIPKENTNVPNGLAEDLKKEASAYDQLIEDLGGIDLMVMGIGRNGHIAFNEPGTSFTEGTHVTDLTEDTIEANSRYFDAYEDVPKQALTMGLHTMMKSEAIILLASGEGKKDAVEKMINGEVTEELPASILQKHENVTVIADEDAL